LGGKTDQSGVALEALNEDQENWLARSRARLVQYLNEEFHYSSRGLWEFLCIGALYFLLAKAGLALASINPSATPIWPPTGLALAAVLLRGYRAGLAIFLAAFLANETTAGSFLSSCGIAAGNALECVLGGYLVKRWSDGRATFDTTTGVARFALVSLLVATPISATVGVGSLAVAGYADTGHLVPVWITWWLGDLAGALIVTPLILLWANAPAGLLARRELRGMALAFGGAVLVGLLAFSPLIAQSGIRDPLGFLAIVPLMWTALRRGQRDTATVVFVLSCFAVWGTEMRGGPFARATLNDSFLLLVMFMISISVPGLALSADSAARRRAEGMLRKAHRELNQRVQQRTKALEAAQQELHQAQKMEALGQLTGGIAHDFNNVLTAITNSLEPMRASAAGEPKQLLRVERALQAARNGAALVQQMLTFARKQPLRALPTDINKLLRATVDVFGRSLAENIHIAWTPAKDLPWAKVDAPQLQTAVLNLVANARDAMPAGGTITIATMPIPQESSLTAELPDGNYIGIVVADEGSGMPPEILARALEPFFTTKEIGKGTGLGLSMVYSAMQQIGGGVHIESEPGKGTRVQLILPAASAMPEDAKVEESNQEGEAAKLSRPHLLYVEDDVLVSLATVDLLELAGYRVHSAPDAKRALSLLNEHPTIGMLVTDIGLPGLNGHELAVEARLLRPDLKVLFLSGFDATGLALQSTEDAQTRYLAKPYDDEALFQALQRLAGAKANLGSSTAR
jgi:signal transduction histidine kinase/ActR/RegA family two-component response regulator